MRSDDYQKGSAVEGVLINLPTISNYLRKTEGFKQAQADEEGYIH